MELDSKKKIVIGIVIIIVLGILIYLYYDYANSKADSIDINVTEDDEFEKEQLESNIMRNNEEKGENIIIIHITGAVKNPRNCKIK